MSEIVITFQDGTTQVLDADTVRAIQQITTATVWRANRGEGFFVPHTVPMTLHEAVERVTTPCPNRPNNSCGNHAVVTSDGHILQCDECHAEMYPAPTDQEMIEMAEEMESKARKVRALETQPRAQPRSSCCGTLGRRMSRFGNYCAACQHHTDEDRGR